jgi:hypothetical protein
LSTLQEIVMGEDPLRTLLGLKLKLYTKIQKISAVIGQPSNGIQAD